MRLICSILFISVIMLVNADLILNALKSAGLIHLPDDYQLLSEHQTSPVDGVHTYTLLVNGQTCILELNIVNHHIFLLGGTPEIKTVKDTCGLSAI
ncbi:hypothetical protein ACF0H5_020850 [Mactra antiquata]